MTNEAAQGMLEILLPEIRDESATTRKVLAAVPAGNHQYKPSEKCMTGLELASHIALSEAFFLRGVIDGGFAWKPEEFADPAAVLAYYDQTVPPLIEELATLPPEKLVKDIKFAMWNQPAVMYLLFALKHDIHHRGQLSSYLRPMGAKVPAIYGPSADESVKAAASE
jgi:uncharacterized damage-inducible protein DinB